MGCIDRPCAADHPTPVAGCALCWRALNCGEWQAAWCLPVTAPPCYAPGAALAPGPPPPPPPGPPGPGSVLRAVLAEWGVPRPPGCRCDERAAQMNAWGVDGCRARRAEIAGWLRAEWAALPPAARLAAAARALAAGFVHPLDPFGALVDLAIAGAADAARGAGHVD